MGSLKAMGSSMSTADKFAIGQGIAGVAGSLFAPKSNSKSFMAQSGPYVAAQAMYQQSIDNEVAAQNDQADIAMSEANAEAARVAREAKDFRENQANTYNNSGVLLEGSPMAVLNDTVEKASAEINAIQRRGAAQASLYRRQALKVANNGRATLLGQTVDFNNASAKAGLADLENNGTPFVDSLNSLAGVFSNKYRSVNTAAKKSLLGNNTQP